MFSKNNDIKYNNYVKYYSIYSLIIFLFIVVHYEMKVLQFNYCSKNIFIHYLMKNSNMCMYLDTYSKAIEKLMFYKLDNTVNLLMSNSISSLY
jgi:hypothetical protein